MIDAPEWLKTLDASPLLILAGVLLGATIVVALVVEGLPSMEAAGPLVLAVFVLAMIVVDWRRRD